MVPESVSLVGNRRKALRSSLRSKTSKTERQNRTCRDDPGRRIGEPKTERKTAFLIHRNTLLLTRNGNGFWPAVLESLAQVLVVGFTLEPLHSPQHPPPIREQKDADSEAERIRNGDAVAEPESIAD